MTSCALPESVFAIWPVPDRGPLPSKVLFAAIQRRVASAWAEPVTLPFCR